MIRKISIVLSLFLAAGLFAQVNMAQNTGFTYQGSLNSGGVVANGNHDFEFALFDAASGGAQVGSTLPQNGVAVANGIFAVTLDFGNQFPGANRFLEVRVRPAGGGAFTTLIPREQIKAVPYAVKSLNSEQLGGVAATQYVTITTGGANFIENATTQQASSNFNISGVGVVGTRMSVGTPVAHPQLPEGFLFTVGGLQPSVVGGNGTNAVAAVGIRGGKGGNTSGGTGTVGGSGANLVIEAGSGGDVTTPGGTSQGGEGGSIVLIPGSGGIGGMTSGNGENGLVIVNGKITADSYEIGEDRIVFGDDNGNTSIGFNSGRSISTGIDNTFLGHQSGQDNSSGSRNTFVGKGAGQANMSGNNNTTLGYNANVNTGGLSYATAIGADAIVNTSNTIQLGRGGGADDVRVPGQLTTSTLVIQSVSGVSGINPICVTAANLVKLCSSSLRYKQNVNPFSAGLNLIKQLRPVSFDWKQGGTPDFGLVAEEVAEVEPRLTTFNGDGEVEGVKYDRIGVIAVNAIKEQQAMIEAQQKQIELQRQQIDALTKLVCESKRRSSLCGPR